MITSFYARLGCHYTESSFQVLRKVYAKIDRDKKNRQWRDQRRVLYFEVLEAHKSAQKIANMV